MQSYLETGVKIFLDDIRNPPDNSWTIARTADVAIEFLKTGKGKMLSYLRAIGRETEFSAMKATEAFKSLFKSGYSTADALKVVRTILETNTAAGVHSISTMASAMNKIYKLFGKESEENIQESFER
jgi:hypothetical protein